MCISASSQNHIIHDMMSAAEALAGALDQHQDDMTGLMPHTMLLCTWLEGEAEVIVSGTLLNTKQAHHSSSWA